MSEGDLSQKLDQVLSDPARLAQIAALAKSFAGEGGGEGMQAPPAAPPAPPLPSLSFLPPEFLRDWKSHAGERIALLRAVRPFLEPDRREKLDRVISVLRTVDLITAMQK